MGNPDAKAAAKAAKAARKLQHGRSGRKKQTALKHQNGHNDGLPKTPTA